MPIIYCIDGNIGSGKTTVLNELEKRGFHVFREDINKWKWCLDKFYIDPYRWAFTLQMTILNSMLEQRKQIHALNTPITFIERSPMSMWAFARVGHKRGYISDDELKLLEEILEKVGWTPEFIVLLDTPVEECFKRMQKRGRECEKDVNLSYLQDLADEYQKLKKSFNLDHTGTKVDVAERVLALL